MRALYAAIVLSVFILSGCVVRTYPVTRDRVDQDLSTGNHGYLMGKAPAGEQMERPSTRTTKTVEIELRPLIKFERRAAKVETSAAQEEKNVSEEKQVVTAGSNMTFETYTVQKNDTLQKISQKFYGTTRRWMKIFEANKDKLKTPNSIRPGQTLNIPVEAKQEMKEPKGNLK